MKRPLKYLLWSFLALAFVFASVAAPVVLAKAQERKIVGQVSVVQVAEGEQLDLSQSISFEDQIMAFAIADLYTKIPRNAYPSELSAETAVEKTNEFLRLIMEEFRQQIISDLNPAAPDVETLLSNAVINTVLYESPSGSDKVAYWNITYQWEYEDRTVMSEENWPIYYITVNCDTVTGNLFSVEYRYLTFMHFKEDCGLQTFADMLGLGGKLELASPFEFHFEDASELSYAIIAEWKINMCFPLIDEAFCIMKSMGGGADSRERIQLIPNSIVAGSDIYSSLTG